MSPANLRGATLVDTGPWVGGFDRSDQDHARCLRFFSGQQGVRVSTWPVLTEVCHRVPSPVAPRFLEWTRLGGVPLQDLPAAAPGPMGGWMEQVADLPIDLADASLLWVANQNGIRRITALDRRDWGIDRLSGGKVLINALEGRG